MSLKERAEQLARGEQAPAPAEQVPPPAPAAEPVELPDVEADEPDGGPDQVPVHIAWSRVMGDIRKIAKGDKYSAPGTRFDFRGVDRTVNAFGPVVRRHGVLILPVGVEAAHRDTKTSKGNAMRECTVKVRWMVMGPKGDALPEFLESAGEALDSSDKGTAKAQSVALRVLLLTAALVPTGDPDPDSSHHERGEAPIRTPASYRDEALDPRTTFARLGQIRNELNQHRMAGALVTNENGEEEPVANLVLRLGVERRPSEPTP